MITKYFVGLMTDKLLFLNPEKNMSQGSNYTSHIVFNSISLYLFKNIIHLKSSVVSVIKVLAVTYT
jgi:hypothetical protein